MLGKIFGHGEEFFDLFEKTAGLVVEGARVFSDMLERRTPRSEIAGPVARIREIEHQCDKTVHETVARLNKTFLTPLDREDIYSLTTRLDDILDLIDDIVMRLEIYPADLAGPHGARLGEMSSLLYRTTQEVASTISRLRSLKRPEDILASCIQVNHLESEADALFRRTLAELVATEHDPIQLFLWKELYEMLEDAVDACEDMANILENIVIKHA
jgi:uncharacterized protein Yka (UPF0111/DUF47 family)